MSETGTGSAPFPLPPPFPFRRRTLREDAYHREDRPRRVGVLSVRSGPTQATEGKERDCGWTVTGRRRVGRDFIYEGLRHPSVQFRPHPRPGSVEDGVQGVGWHQGPAVCPLSRPTSPLVVVRGKRGSSVVLRERGDFTCFRDRH